MRVTHVHSGRVKQLYPDRIDIVRIRSLVFSRGNIHRNVIVCTWSIISACIFAWKIVRSGIVQNRPRGASVAIPLSILPDLTTGVRSSATTNKGPEILFLGETHLPLI